MIGLYHRLNSGQGGSHSEDDILKNDARTGQKSLRVSYINTGHC